MTEQNQLSAATLARLAKVVQRPAYDRDEINTGIVHLGIGAFHRAHQAVYTDAVLASGDNRWGILGVSLRSADTRDALQPQNGLYTVAVRDGSGDRFSVIGSITNVLVAPENPQAVLSAMVAPSVKIVSLTVTEKGYCYAPATASLDESHQDIVHDLAHPAAPRSAIGFIVEALARRRENGTEPFTLLSCDNLPANGETLKRVVLRFAELRDPDLAMFIRESVAFPSTMVDRIVPATIDTDRAIVAQATGLRDAWPIMTEPFTQWVVEDHFPSGRPAWEKVGVTFVEDVDAFELMKLRLLNGSHSTLAYLGYLAGHETVSDVMQAEGFSAFIEAMMDEEITPTLPPLSGFDVSSYKAQLRERFRNPALRHRTWQIAMDGSQKLPQRLLNTIRKRIEQGQPFKRLALGVAAWMRYATGIDERGQPIDVRDPLANDFRERTQGKTSGADLLDAYLGMQQIFGEDLADKDEFRRAVGGALEQLLRDGAALTVAKAGRD
ncbi:mannitol dehydrogenase family protein [Phyllobacterium sp. SYP-B3895]|uniref:mannitol dehydrogenase family protein n=1 Tax=Phyllobacterium sp. SYP-B3895 TaxID=2663240 RepID=UPI0012996308|nr:mannitol dehydrogenase family protein [Phyllobacterium sp. SYP-B3895]MRG54571.1 mannitol dehydrogenase family protein [Phyllobacterium sp. SYP-B3895]